MLGSISVVIPTYNRSALLIEALDALLTQTRPVKEIIIWDDGSTDATDKSVAQYQKAHREPPLHYYKGENGGRARALNSGIARASGDYIWICDDDDLVLPQAAEKLGHILDTKNVALAAGRHTRFTVAPHTKERLLKDTGYWPDLSSGSILRHSLEDIFFFHNATFVHHEAYRAVGPFRPDLIRSADYEMTVRLLARFSAEVIEDVLFLQRKHEGLRGPAWALHHQDQSDSVWLKADQEIFLKFRAALPLSLYEAMYQAPDPEVIKRAALLQRAAVYARRCLWPLALEDFSAACKILPEVSLTPEEQKIVIRAVSGKYGAAGLYEGSSAAAVSELAATSPLGREIVTSMSRGLLWRLRVALQKGRLKTAASIIAFMAQYPPMRHAHSKSELLERDKLPEEAYAW